MAKRVRGSTSRPGQRPPLQRNAPRSTAKPAAPATQVTSRPDALTDDEEARAAVLEAAIVAEEREHEAAQRSARATRTANAPSVLPESGLAVSAAQEYAYVARDVRRIVLVGGSLVAFLIGLWVISSVTGFSLI